ncbi:FMN-binding protein [Mesorhizobium erdmanii]|uniref:FMN-binding protein n=1 Tax=Mesorhizobium erdmanii TaxID=1777866 RepID=UPI000415BA2E|nr:FMN-binding protein [Mesorhizobium erdmanii]
MKKIALSFFVLASSGAYVWEQPAKAPAIDITDTTDASTVGKSVQEAGDPASAPVAPVTPPPRLARMPVQQSVLPPAAPAGKVGNETTAAIFAPAPSEQAARPTATEDSPIALDQPKTSLPPPELSKRVPAEIIADAAPQTMAFAATPAVYIPVPQPRPDYPQSPARVIKAGMKATVNRGTKPAGHGFADGTYIGPVTDAYYGLMQIQASIQGGRLTSLKVLKYPSDRRTSVNINRQALPMLRDEAISAQSANVDIISGATLTSRAFRQSLAGALKQASS